MAEDLDVLNAAVPLPIRATLLAARFSGRVRTRSLKRLAAMDTDAKAREIVSLKDKIYELEMQLAILQKPKPRNPPGVRGHSGQDGREAGIPLYSCLVSESCVVRRHDKDLVLGPVVDSGPGGH